MRSRHFALVATVVTIVSILVVGNTSSVAAQSRSVYAISNARIYPVSGPMIEGGTIVIRNGLIEDVGANITIPAEATVIDGEGLTVFPGLIDSFSDIGLVDQDTSDDDEALPPPRTTREAIFQQTEALHPDRELATEVGAEGKNITEARNVGITSALVVSRDGILTGQSVLINTGEENLVVKTPVALHFNIERADRGYPTTLMGAMALIRQTVADAEWYQNAWERFDESPRGVERPAFDPVLAAVVPITEGAIPAVIHADWTSDIKRALALTEELDLNPIIAGGMEAAAVAELLADRDIPVLVSVNYEHRKPKPGFGRSGGDVEYSAEEVEIYNRNAALLADAGVRFALQSGFASAPADFIDNVRTTIDNGLSMEDALRATTLSAAEILGIDDALGSLEAGKIANLVVANGDPFGADTVLERVFVDGQPYNVPEQDSGDGAAETETAAIAEAGEENPSGPSPIIKPGNYITEGPAETLVQNGTILTITNGTIENGDVLIRDGEIVAVGQNLDVPEGARVIDATGRFVMPGIIDAHSHMAIEGGGNEGSSPITPSVRIADVIREDDIAIYRALAGGTTIVNILHGSANVIGGTNAVIKLRWGKPAEDLFFGAPAGIKFALGENPTRANRAQPADERRFPGTRMGIQQALRESFTLAREYQREWDAYEEAIERGEDPLAPRRDLKLETLAEVLRGNIMVHAHSYRADEIVMLMNVADEFGFKIRTLQHVLEGYKVAQEIAAHGAGASTFADFWSYKVEAFDAIPYNAAIMQQYGVNVSINSDSNETVRRLYQEASKVVRYGDVSENDALRMITINPALQLGIDGQVGSIEVGKDGDLAIFNAHPLSNFARVDMTLIDGQVYFDREQDLANRAVEVTDE